MGEDVCAVIAAFTAPMEGSRRACENGNVERAPAPVTTTVVHPVEPGVNTTETHAEERDTESHHNNSTPNMDLTGSHCAKRENETQKTQMSDLHPREKLQVIDGVQHADPISVCDILPEIFRRIASIPWFSCSEILADRE